MYDIYFIEPGDTMESIANKVGVNIDVLRELNPSSSFATGSQIVIPTMNRYFDMYTIEKGDTLYEIARRYNTDYNLLALLNGINTSDYIYPGTMIMVPKRDVKYYLTRDGDTLIGINRKLGANLNDFLRQNNNIYLKEGQLIVYKD